MKALVYNGTDRIALEDRPEPVVGLATDAVVKITRTTLCGTDLHLLKGDIRNCEPGRVLGREGVGVVVAKGAAVRAFDIGDHVLIAGITSCGACGYCRTQMYAHCVEGGRTLGRTIDGTQAEFVRIPHADTSLYAIPPGADEEALVVLSDILPASLECGRGWIQIRPGSQVAIVGAGPIGLAALLTVKRCSPAAIIMIDIDDDRLNAALRFGATASINSAGGRANDAVMTLTNGRGVDTAIEAVGVIETFELCEKIITGGGMIANIGVHGTQVNLFLEKLWDRNISLTTRRADPPKRPPPDESGNIRSELPGTRYFKLSQILDAYEAFGHASATKVLKVIVEV